MKTKQKIDTCYFCPARLNYVDKDGKNPYILGIFTDERIDKESQFTGKFKHVYEVRHCDDDLTVATEISTSIIINFMGSFVTEDELPEGIEFSSIASYEEYSNEKQMPDYISQLEFCCPDYSIYAIYDMCDYLDIDAMFNDGKLPLSYRI